MTHKRFNLFLHSTLHSLVFLSLCLAPLLHNVLHNIQNETAIENTAKVKSQKDTLNSEGDTSEVGLNNPLKDFWSLTRLSQRYFTQRKITSRKNTTSFSLYSKAPQNITQSVLNADSNIVLEQPINQLANGKRYLSQAKLRLEGG